MTWRQCDGTMELRWERASACTAQSFSIQCSLGQASNDQLNVIIYNNKWLKIDINFTRSLFVCRLSAMFRMYFWIWLWCCERRLHVYNGSFNCRLHSLQWMSKWMRYSHTHTLTFIQSHWVSVLFHYMFSHDLLRWVWAHCIQHTLCNRMQGGVFNDFCCCFSVKAKLSFFCKCGASENHNI